MKIRAGLLTAFLSLCSLCAVPPAFSQGCAMCGSYVEASSKGGQKAINKGVLLLLLPPAGFMTLGLAAAYRYSRKRDLEQS
jgi:Na+-translocating ferredoxin:NAD+ oxidoreductase RnfE subunit